MNYLLRNGQTPYYGYGMPNNDMTATVGSFLGQPLNSYQPVDIASSYDMGYNPGDMSTVGAIINTPSAVEPLPIGFTQDPRAWAEGLYSKPRTNFVDPVVASANNTLNQLGEGTKETLDSTKLAWGDMDLSQRIGTVGGVFKDLYGLYNANQQLNVAKDTLDFNKKTWNQRWDAQAKMTNSQLSDRQARRVQTATINGNANSVDSVSDYMKKYGV